MGEGWITEGMSNKVNKSEPVEKKTVGGGRLSQAKLRERSMKGYALNVVKHGERTIFAN